MADVNMQKAREVYGTIMSMLDSIGWTYDRYDDELCIKSGVSSDDLPIHFTMTVRPEPEVVQFRSILPFKMPEDKRIDGAIAVCVANYRFINGCFDYDIADGEISFRLTSSYRDSYLSEELMKYMIMVSSATVDEYNDKFFMIGKGVVTIQQFIEQENS